jgi:hypothetical protein
MDNAFKSIMPKEKLPSHIEKKVMANVYSLDFFLKISELFTINFMKSVGRQFNSDKNDKKQL